MWQWVRRYIINITVNHVLSHWQFFLGLFLINGEKQLDPYRFSNSPYPCNVPPDVNWESDNECFNCFLVFVSHESTMIPGFLNNTKRMWPHQRKLFNFLVVFCLSQCNINNDLLRLKTLLVFTDYGVIFLNTGSQDILNQSGNLNP